MSLSFYIDNYTREIGSPSFLESFFSTIAYHLESQKWGSKYPELMKELYQGKLEPEKATKVLEDFLEIQQKLKNFTPDKVIWDIDDLQKRPPWGSKISSDISDLSNYFVTSTGEDLFVVIIDCLEKLGKNESPLLIK